MASRPLFTPYPVVTNGDMSQTSIISKVTIIQSLSMVGYDISWSGSSPVGTCSVQVSNTYSQDSNGAVKNAGNWTTLTLSSPCSVSGNTGNGAIDVDATGFYAIRFVYTKVSGTGTLNVTVNGKVA